MAVTTVTLIESGEGGGTREKEIKLQTVGFFIVVDGENYSPAVTTNVEIENDGDVAQPQDQCGRIERTKVSDKGWNVRVQGIITGNDERDGNLSMQLMRDYVATADSVEVHCDLFDGEIVVGNLVITQANDLVSVNTRDTHGDEAAFEFQLQLGEQDTE